ncbi:hypothetical protein GF336_04240 [Candidatus Woesearchaeota archaeon]|nr:hypothetical protein [Candidatus Woesearchaeota archaeon]
MIRYQKDKFPEYVQNLRFCKKAQAAMEFLMTYGWALLVVLAAIGALAYFGVLSPGKFVPDQCVLVPGLACLDSSVTSSEINLVLANSLGRDIQVNGLSVGGCNKTLDVLFENGDKRTFNITGCDNGEPEEKFSGDIIIDYTNRDSGLSKTITGKLTSKVQ